MNILYQHKPQEYSGKRLLFHTIEFCFQVADKNISCVICFLLVGMNPSDTKVRKREEKDKVLGWDAYGVVEKTGEGVTGFTAGDKVFYAGDITRPGCNSEYHLVDYRIAALAPEKSAGN